MISGIGTVSRGVRKRNTAALLQVDSAVRAHWFAERQHPAGTKCAARSGSCPRPTRQRTGWLGAPASARRDAQRAPQPFTRRAARSPAAPGARGAWAAALHSRVRVRGSAGRSPCEPKPPMAPSSMVIITGCSRASRRISAVSSGLQNLRPGAANQAPRPERGTQAPAAGSASCPAACRTCAQTRQIRRQALSAVPRRQPPHQRRVQRLAEPAPGALGRAHAQALEALPQALAGRAPGAAIEAAVHAMAPAGAAAGAAAAGAAADRRRRRRRRAPGTGLSGAATHGRQSA